jgi:hypothetical protein
VAVKSRSDAIHPAARSKPQDQRDGRLGHPPPDAAFVATPKQEELIETIFSGRYTVIGFGGAIRGTKTWGSIAAIILLCKVYPGSRWAIVRGDLPTLRRNTIPSFNKLRSLARNFVGEINQSTWTAECVNGSEIIFFPEGFDRDPDLDRWKGLEVNGFLLEEANELNEKSLYKAIERAGSWFTKDINNQPPPMVICTFNPAQNWVRRIFYDPWRTGTIQAPYYFLPATIQDNLKNLPPAEYKRFVEGDWEVNDDPDQLIKAEWVIACQRLEHIPTVSPRRKLGVDVARFGDDQSVFAMVTDSTLDFTKPFLHVPTDRLAAFTMNYINDTDLPIKAEDVHIDSVGVGGGVVDIMRKHGYKVTEIISGAKPIPRAGSFFKFANLRSQMWWEFREKLRTGIFSLPAEIEPKLLGDLTAPRYEIRSDKVIMVESKQDIKLRLGRSTDYGDAVVYAAFDMPHRRPVRLPPSVSQPNHRL